MKDLFDIRVIKLGFVILLFGLLVIARLFYIIVLDGDKYIALAQSSRVETIDVNQFERGNILDTNGESFTNNEENCLVVFPQLVSNKDWLIYCVRDIVNSETDKLKIEEEWQSLLEENSPFILHRDLSEPQIERYNDIISQNDLTGVFVLNVCPRYSLDFTACHVLGFVGEASEEDLDFLNQKGLSSSTLVGKNGIEKQYDQYLINKESDKIGVVADEKSHQISDELRLFKAESNTESGYDVVLTLNKDYQEFLDEAMANKNGGAILMEVDTGDILAVSSSPEYNQYSGQTDSQGNEYVNKAFSYYPPASVFKTVLVLAALEENVVCNNNFYCTGSITLPGGHKVRCWEEEGHGKEDLQTALGNSCNPYFVELGQKLGGKTIMDYAYNLGLGEQKIIGYNVNSLEDNINYDIRAEADIANVSIGENGVRLSPLLVAQLMSTIANGGDVIIPRLVKGVVNSNGEFIKRFASAEPRKVIETNNCEILQDYLLSAVTGGTGKPVNSSVVQIAGKTGTTQNAGVWFAGYAPADNPKYAIAVYDADGESGGSDAGSVAKEVFEKIAVVEGFR